MACAPRNCLARSDGSKQAAQARLRRREREDGDRARFADDMAQVVPLPGTKGQDGGGVQQGQDRDDAMPL